MSYSIQQVGPSADVIESVLVSISYFDREEITVLIDGVETPLWEWAGTTENLINMTPPVEAGHTVTIIRTTDLADLRHKYAGGARFDRSTLDESFRQILHIAQEASERAISGDFFLDLDLHGNRVKNIADGTEEGHAATIRQLNEATGYDIPNQRALAQAARAGAEIAQAYAEDARDAAIAAKDQAVDAVNGALQKSQNLADLGNVVAARANLGLTSAAITPVGTGPNQLVKLDSEGYLPSGVIMRPEQTLLPYLTFRADMSQLDSWPLTYKQQFTDVVTNAATHAQVIDYTTPAPSSNPYDSVLLPFGGVWLIAVSGRRMFGSLYWPHIRISLNTTQVTSETLNVDSPTIGKEYSVSCNTTVIAQPGDTLFIQGHLLASVTLVRLA